MADQLHLAGRGLGLIVLEKARPQGTKRCVNGWTPQRSHILLRAEVLDTRLAHSFTSDLRQALDLTKPTRLTRYTLYGHVADGHIGTSLYWQLKPKVLVKPPVNCDHRMFISFSCNYRV